MIRETDLLCIQRVWAHVDAHLRVLPFLFSRNDGESSAGALQQRRREALIWLLYEWERETSSLSGDVESASHSDKLKITVPVFARVTHLGCWQENVEIKETPFVRRLKVAAVFLSLFFFLVLNAHDTLLYNRENRITDHMEDLVEQ